MQDGQLIDEQQQMRVAELVADSGARMLFVGARVETSDIGKVLKRQLREDWTKVGAPH